MFANVLEYNLKTSIEQSGFRGNSFYFLVDKTYKLRERIEGVLMDLARKIDKAQLESIKVDIGSGNVSAVQKGDDRRKKIATSGGESEIVKEDGHTDVASSKRKVMIMVDDSNKLLNKLNGMNKEDSLPSWWSDKITLSQNYLQKATNYLLNPVEEAIDYKKNTPKSLKKSNFKSLDILVPKGRVSFVMKALKKEVPRIKISHEEVDSFTKDGLIVSNFKKDDINKIMTIADHAGSLFEAGGVEKIMKMADDYSYGKLAGKTVDVMTAKLFQAAYNKASQSAKDKVDKMNEKQLYIFMMNLWKRFGKQVRLGS